MHTSDKDIRFYPGVENATFPRISRVGYIRWLNWNSRTWSSSDAIVMLK